MKPYDWGQYDHEEPWYEEEDDERDWDDMDEGDALYHRNLDMGKYDREAQDD